MTPCKFVSVTTGFFANPEKETPETSLLESLWAKPFVPTNRHHVLFWNTIDTSQESKRKCPCTMACSSRALGNAHSLNVQDSFADVTDPEPLQSSRFAIHSELLEAERDLVSSYRQAAMSAMDKGRILVEDETQASIAWKRFAISLSALYSYEKDIETLRIEDGPRKKRPTYRKLGKTNVDELLRLMTKQKADRSTPALRGLDAMLSAYVGDLSAVNPAVKAYSEAIIQLSNLEDRLGDASISVSDSKKARSVSSNSSWQDQIRTMANTTLVEVKKQITGESVKSETTSTTLSTEADGEISQKRAFEARVLANERLLRDSMTALCRGTQVRVARMAWRYFSTEASQCALLKSCAHSMRTKVNIINHDALKEMIERHKKESKQDAETEMKLVQSIVTIGDYKKATPSSDQKETDVVDEWDVNDDKKQAIPAKRSYGTCPCPSRAMGLEGWSRHYEGCGRRGRRSAGRRNHERASSTRTSPSSAPTAFMMARPTFESTVSSLRCSATFLLSSLKASSSSFVSAGRIARS